MASMTRETAVERAAVLRQIRDFFGKRKVLEVETPVLMHGAPADGHIDLISADYHPAGAGEKKRKETVFCRPSPEFHMKRLLAAGFRDIYQIGRVFRDGEQGRIHNPEFTMLEWYRVGMDMDGLMDETAALITEVLGQRKIEKRTYEDVFRVATGIDPLAARADEVAGYCASRGKALFPGATLTDALQFAMAEFVEPALSKDAIIFIHHYPADQAVLAVLEPEDARTARRFEAYCGGMELVNGFEELVDADENERRQLEENRKRAVMGKPVLPPDRRFIGALKAGMPRCSGAALGLDRLVMLALGKKEIAEVLAFPWEDA